MGLFGPSKTKIAPDAFIKTQLDAIFSAEFVNVETNEFARLSNETTIGKLVTLNDYLRERQYVVSRLFHIAWDRNTPYDIFINCSSIINDDPRIKAIDTGAYDMALSRAEEAGMDTFGFIAKVFLSQIITEGVNVGENDYGIFHVFYRTEFARRFIGFEALIRRHRFVK